MKRLNKRGNILTENVIFILLNVVFLIIIFLFVFSKMSNSAGLEERYAKQIALMIDAAKPGMEIHLKMDDAIHDAQDSGFDLNKVVTISDNVVNVKVNEKSKGASYSFFNNVKVNALYSPKLEKDKKVIPAKYVFVVSLKWESKV